MAQEDEEEEKLSLKSQNKKASVHIRDAKCRLKCWELGQAHREHTRQSPSASHLEASPPQIMHNIISCLP